LAKFVSVLTQFDARSDTKERNQLLASADLQGLQGNLREIAEDSEAFEGLINTAFGDNIAPDKIDSLRRDLIDGTLVLPNVSLVDTNTLAGATGAFEAATNTIYLDERLAGTAEGRNDRRSTGESGVPTVGK